MIHVAALPQDILPGLQIPAQHQLRGGLARPSFCLVGKHTKLGAAVLSQAVVEPFHVIPGAGGGRVMAVGHPIRPNDPGKILRLGVVEGQAESHRLSGLKLQLAFPVPGLLDGLALSASGQQDLPELQFGLIQRKALQGDILVGSELHGQASAVAVIEGGRQRLVTGLGQPEAGVFENKWNLEISYN